MLHFFYRDLAGNVHVDTRVDGKRFRHHVHSAEDFSHWRALVVANSLVPLPDMDCGCDLVVGQVLEHSGRIWNHPQFV